MPNNLRHRLTFHTQQNFLCRQFACRVQLFSTARGFSSALFRNIGAFLEAGKKLDKLQIFAFKDAGVFVKIFQQTFDNLANALE